MRSALLDNKVNWAFTLIKLIANISFWSDSKDLLNVMYYWNKVRELNSDSSERSTSTEVMVRYRALKFITGLEYEYAQVTVDLFYENVTLAHCSVVF